MNRAQILWLQCWIAFSGAVFWSLPPQLPHTLPVIGVSSLWALLALAAIFLPGLESWAHRLSAFGGFLLFTVEGMLGLLGLGKPGILVVALMHGFTFLLAVAGKYLGGSRRRSQLSLEEIARRARLEESETESHEATP